MQARTARARELYSELQGKCRPFVDFECLKPGTLWDVELAAAQRASRATVLLISKATTGAMYAREEASVAVALTRFTNGAHQLIPVYLDGPLNVVENTIYGTFNLQAIDLRKEGGVTKVAERVLAALSVAAHSVVTPADEPAVQKHPLLEYRGSPAVEPFLVRRVLIQAYANMIPPAQAELTVDEAIAIRVEAEPHNAELRFLSHAELPPPNHTAPLVYWNEVFKNACLYGPRMVAALLLSAPPDHFTGEVQAARTALLAQLK